MKHASIYLIEGQARKSETQAFRRYTIHKQEEGETDMAKIKEEFITYRNSLRTKISYLKSINDNVTPNIEGGKFEEGCTRIDLNNEITNNEDVTLLNNIIGILFKNKELYIKYDKNLNNLSLEELKNQFQKTLQQISNDERNEIENMGQNTQSQNYDIVRISSFEEAKKYYPYCIHKSFSNSGNKPEWCITYNQTNYEHYSDKGLNQIYFCIRKDINENDNPIMGNGHPQDDYGNSMISIIVDSNGELSYATTRWNHELKGSDQAYSVVDISRIVGVDFYKTFKPNHTFQEEIDNALNILRNEGNFNGFQDTKPSNFSDDYVIVELRGLNNVLNTKTFKFISNKWFDVIKEFYDGCAAIYDMDRGSNFINIDGQIISNEWFTQVRNFKNNITSVQKYSKGWNFIDTKGNILSDTWFDDIYNFNSYGFAKVILNRKGHNFIDTNMNLISDTWFRSVEDFKEGFARVKIDDNGWNYINTKGEILNDIKFSKVSNFSEGYARVQVENNGWNWIDQNGNFLSNIWFDGISSFFRGIAKVIKDNKQNVMLKNGKLLSSIWFDETNQDLFMDRILVKIQDKEYFLDYFGDLYDKNKNFIKNVSPQQDGEDIANESLKRKYAKELNEVLNLNKRIKRLYK